MNNATQKGLPVSGYQAQSQSNIDKVNAAKRLEEIVLRHLDVLAADPEIDQRWLAIARTNIEQGFMAANRAVFKPGRVRLIEDAAG
jgi:hypothetical protein